jgi:hypothetical protein
VIAGGTREVSRIFYPDHQSDTPLIEIYRSSTNTVSTYGQLNVPKNGPNIQVLDNQQVAVWGGYEKTIEFASPKLEIFDPSKELKLRRSWWSGKRDGQPVKVPATKNRNFSVVNAAIVDLGNDRILSVGGITGARRFLNEIRELDFKSGKIVRKVALSGNLGEHTATLTQDKSAVIIIGGQRIDRVGPYPLSTIMKFDLAKNTLDETWSALPIPRNSHTATLLASGKIAVVGGVGSYSYNPDKNVYAKVEVVPGSSRGVRPYVWKFGPDGEPLELFLDSSLNNIDVLDPQTGELKQWGRLNESRMNHTATPLPDGRILIVGGQKVIEPVGGSLTVEELSSIELIDFEAGTIKVVGHLKQGRHVHTANLLPDGRVVIAGGLSKSGELNSIEVITVKPRH